MSSCFPYVKTTIESLIRRWISDTNTKFAVVAYTEHGPHNGHYNADNPIGVFPYSNNMNDGYH